MTNTHHVVYGVLWGLKHIESDDRDRATRIRSTVYRYAGSETGTYDVNIPHYSVRRELA